MRTHGRKNSLERFQKGLNKKNTLIPDRLIVSIPGYRIKRASLLTIKTSLEAAKQLGAVKMKEIVDKEKIKKLYLEGHNPPDVTEVHFIQVYAEATVSANTQIS